MKCRTCPFDGGTAGYCHSCWLNARERGELISAETDAQKIARLEAELAEAKKARDGWYDKYHGAQAELTQVNDRADMLRATLDAQRLVAEALKAERDEALEKLDEALEQTRDWG